MWEPPPPLPPFPSSASVSEITSSTPVGDNTGTLIWRSAYLTRDLSRRNMFYVAVNWATTLVFGRDNSRIG
ncbi:hypothetical protein Q3G72_015262 [Acer saccharum]|nr:hypothetical protein Q3G72_015262 [Acer saccharum]